MPYFPIDDKHFRDVDDCLKQLLHRSARDQAFRHRLLTHPQEALEEHLGKRLNVPLNIHFIENKADATIVLPDYQGDRLTEEEQEMVTGGTANAMPPHQMGLHTLSIWLASHVD